MTTAVRLCYNARMTWWHRGHELDELAPALNDALEPVALAALVAFAIGLLRQRERASRRRDARWEW